MYRCVVCLFVCAGTVLSQELPVLNLTLRDAVALALKQSPQVILGTLATAQAQEERTLARAGLLPQVSGRLQQTVNRVNLEASIGFRFPGFSQHVGPYWVSQGGAQFNAPIFDLTLWRRYNASQFGIEASRAGETNAREESVLLVVSQYLGSQRASADVQASQSRVDLAQALYTQAQDLQRAGVGTGIDTLRANVTLQNERQRLIVSRTQLETSLFALARLLAIDPRQRIALTDAVGFFDTPAVNADQTVERAWDSRPELRQILQQERRAEVDIRAAGDARVPRLSTQGFWAEQGLTPATAIPAYQYQFAVDVPLFTGGRIQAERARAEISLRQLKEQERDVRNRIALE